MLILRLGLFLFESLYFLQENAVKYLCSLVRFLINSGSEEGQTEFQWKKLECLPADLSLLLQVL